MIPISGPVTNFVLCLPLLGKPDSTQPKPSEGPDTRGRVIQAGSKDNTCWYAVFNILRDRFKAPNTDDLPTRKVEQIVSSLRKAMSAHDRSLPDIANQLNNSSIKSFLTKLTKEALANPQIVKDLEGLDKQCAPEVSLCSIIPAFLKQEKHQNLYDFLVYLKLFSRRIFTTYFFLN